VIAAATAALSIWLGAASSFAAAARPPVKPTPPPAVVNVVRQKLKRNAVQAYVSLEASIAHAFEHAHVRVFWTCFQSKSDATDILYLNTAESLANWDEIGKRYTQSAAAHPELGRLTDHLRAYVAGPATSTLTTHREEIAFGRTDVDLRTMKALRLTVLEVAAGHEGRFVRAMRRSGRTSPWLVYEANDASTFFLIAPLRSASEGKKGPPLPSSVQELKNVYTVTGSTLYLMRPAMSHIELRTKN
jgi:hypothetical protein